MGLKSGAGDDMGAAVEERDRGEDSDAQRDTGGSSSGGGQELPYIFRRMAKDKSTQFERDSRMTFFVHEDVEEGEDDLLATAKDAFGRDVPRFDLREAVYQAALEDPDAVLGKLAEMGYQRE